MIRDPLSLRWWLSWALLALLAGFAQGQGPCNEEDEGDESICSITKVVTELETIPPTATFSGSFCDAPVVSAGQTDGTLQPLIVLSSGPNQIQVSLEGQAGAADTRFVISCPCTECNMFLTVGQPGPAGPNGIAGPAGTLGPQGTPAALRVSIQ